MSKNSIEDTGWEAAKDVLLDSFRRGLKPPDERPAEEPEVPGENLNENERRGK